MRLNDPGDGVCTSVPRCPAWINSRCTIRTMWAHKLRAIVLHGSNVECKRWRILPSKTFQHQVKNKTWWKGAYHGSRCVIQQIGMRAPELPTVHKCLAGGLHEGRCQPCWRNLRSYPGRRHQQTAETAIASRTPLVFATKMGRWLNQFMGDLWFLVELCNDRHGMRLAKSCSS